jgi:hypothetical protein
MGNIVNNGVGKQKCPANFYAGAPEVAGIVSDG